MPAAAVTAGSSLIQGVVSSQAAGKAGKIGQQAAKQAQDINRGVYESTQQNFNPYLQSGAGATGALSAMLGIGGDQKAQQDAFNRYLNSTNYQFQLGQGLEAVKNAGAASFNSGATAKALGNYAQGQAGSALGGYQSMLGGLAGQGLSAAGTLGNIGSNYAQQAAGNLMTGANARAGGVLGQATAFNSALGGVTQGLSSFGKGFNPIASSFNPSSYAAESGMTMEGI